VGSGRRLGRVPAEKGERGDADPMPRGVGRTEGDWILFLHAGWLAGFAPLQSSPHVFRVCFSGGVSRPVALHGDGDGHTAQALLHGVAALGMREHLPLPVP
jgi:hypothetical protein